MATNNRVGHAGWDEGLGIRVQISDFSYLKPKNKNLTPSHRQNVPA